MTQTLTDYLRLKATGRRRYPTEAGVVFIHHTPQRPNIGDHLCSPRHYFSFVPAQRPLYVMGGGVFGNLGRDRLLKEHILFERVVLWATGRSMRDHIRPVELPGPPYLQWATRDRDHLPDDTHFLPCVSCLHPMLDAPLGNDTLVFLNADSQVSGKDVVARVRDTAARKGWGLLLNDCSEAEMAAALAASRHLVTNSYHGAYWGLLAGRRVTLAGYSSKFRSLLCALELPVDALVPITKGASDELGTLVQSLMGDERAIELPNAAQTLATFRQLNLAFAQRLVDRGIVVSCAPKHPGPTHADGVLAAARW